MSVFTSSLWDREVGVLPWAHKCPWLALILLMTSTGLGDKHLIGWPSNSLGVVAVERKQGAS